MGNNMEDFLGRTYPDFMYDPDTKVYRHERNNKIDKKAKNKKYKIEFFINILKSYHMFFVRETRVREEVSVEFYFNITSSVNYVKENIKFLPEERRDSVLMLCEQLYGFAIKFKPLLKKEPIINRKIYSQEDFYREIGLVKKGMLKDVKRFKNKSIIIYLISVVVIFLIALRFMMK